MDEFYRLVGKLYVEKEAHTQQLLREIEKEKGAATFANQELELVRTELDAVREERDSLLKLMTKPPADDAG